MTTLNTFEQPVDIEILSEVASVACWRWCCFLHCLFMSFISQHRYLQTSALLAGDVNLTAAERKHFCQELLNFSGKSGDKCKWWILTVHNLKWKKKHSLHFIVHSQSVMLRSLWYALVCHKSCRFFSCFQCLSVWCQKLSRVTLCSELVWLPFRQSRIERGQKVALLDGVIFYMFIIK